MTPTRIPVGGERPYEVVIGAAAHAELSGLIGPARTVVLIHAAGLAGLAGPVAATLTQAGYLVHRSAVPDGEAAKEIGVATRLWSQLAAAGVGRTDAVVALGGGAVTDLAGFVAATWLRGVRVVLMPTTLLGMTDAAIGGKTAINTADGKNLVGTFSPPAGVLADVTALATLPPADYVSGLAEVIKAGFIADPPILDLVAADPAAAAKPGGPHEQELIERAIAMKAEVVSADLREAGRREILNYGHTLGHAIERAEDYCIRHGEAVSIATPSHNFLQKNRSNRTDYFFISDAAFAPENTKAIRFLDDLEGKVGGGWRVWERFEPGGYLFGQFRSLEDDSDVLPVD